MATLNFKFYNKARTKLNLTEADAKEFALAIEEEVQSHFKQAGNEYRSAVSEDTIKLEMSLRGEMKELEMSMKGEIKDSKLDIYKAIFITGVVQLLAILGGVLAIVKFIQ